MTAHNNHMFGPENVDVVIRGLQSYPDVPVGDRMRFDNLMTNLLNYFEASVLAADAHTLGDETMENWAWWFEAKIFAYPGAVKWWGKAQGVYGVHPLSRRVHGLSLKPLLRAAFRS